MEYLFQHPTEKNTIRELARKTGMSAPTALILLGEFKKTDLIQEKTVGSASQISANTENKKFLWMKRVANITLLYETGFIHELVERYNDPRAIILFGSYSKGEDTELSNIDLAVLGERSKTGSIFFDKNLSRTVNIRHIPIKHVNDEIKGALQNGIVLHGTL